MWPGDVTLVPYRAPVVNYKRCYDIPAITGELFVTIQLNPLPALDCISAVNVSLNVGDVESYGGYKMYEMSTMSGVGGQTTMAACIPIAEESHALFSYCRYRCEPVVRLAFGWTGSSRLENGITICDLRWNYETCWNKWTYSTAELQLLYL